MPRAAWRRCASTSAASGGAEAATGAGPTRSRTHAPALAALAERLSTGRPLALVGYSFGAWVALQVAAETPGLRVVAVGPPLAFLDWDFLELPAARPDAITIIVGERDQFCPPIRLQSLVAGHGERIAVRTLPRADHFLVGREEEVAAAVAEALDASRRSA